MGKKQTLKWVMKAKTNYIRSLNWSITNLHYALMVNPNVHPLVWNDQKNKQLSIIMFEKYEGCERKYRKLKMLMFSHLRENIALFCILCKYIWKIKFVLANFYIAGHSSGHSKIKAVFKWLTF